MPTTRVQRTVPTPTSRSQRSSTEWTDLADAGGTLVTDDLGNQIQVLVTTALNTSRTQRPALTTTLHNLQDVD